MNKFCKHNTDFFLTVLKSFEDIMNCIKPKIYTMYCRAYNLYKN